ncbi:MAG: O-antigen ligase family protein, partial [Anaerolineae bacterium]|nr:O-antigen ligase family protein [Anaerolineae bacterium]
GGGALAGWAVNQRGVETRGWADAASGEALPFRAPLPGVNVELTQYDAAQRDRELAAIADAGFVWVRQTFAWSEIEPEPGQRDFSRYDALVEAVARHPALRLVAVLDSAPAWARRPEASDRLFAPPQSMAAFGQFAAALAGRYAEHIDHYQIWDEPNLNTHWGGLDPRPADYAAMLAAAYPAIHGADPVATVIAAGLAPTVETGPRNLSDVLYLRALYEAGAKDYFDAAAGKPYGFDRPPGDRTVREDVLNFSRLILLREEMARHGDGHKALWGSHFGWNHLPDGWSGPPSIWGQVDAEAQRQYTLDAYARAAHEWPWLGGLIVQHWEPDAAPDDPIRGFSVQAMAEAGLRISPAAPDGALEPGLHRPDDPRLTYAGEWRFGPLGADVQHTTPGDPPPDGSAHRLEFAFAGQHLALQVRRGDFVAYLYLRVDGEPANALPRIPDGDPVGGGEAYILLKSPTLDPRTETIRAATGLDTARTHLAQARAYLGYERWILAGVAVGESPDTARLDRLIALGVGLALLGALLFTGVGLGARREILPGVAALRNYVRRGAGTLGALGLSVVAALGMLLTLNDFLPAALRRDLPAFLATAVAVGALSLSPALVVTLVALAALWLIVFNRPVIGLALTLFWAPFFLIPVELYVWALPMVEISLLITATAMLARRLLKPLAHGERGWGEGLLLDLGMLLFVILAALSILWAEQINPATRELRIIVLEPALFYLLLRTARLQPGDAVRLVDVLLLAGAAVSAIGLVQYVTGDVGVAVAEQGTRRLMSVYSSPNNLALFLGRCIPYGAAMVLIAPDRWRRLAAGLLTLLMLGALALTQSIGAALLGLPAALAVVLLLWDRRRGLILVGLIALALIGLVAAARFVPRLQGALDLTRNSSLVRTQLWTSTLNLLREKPLTGVGLDQFLYAYRSRYILPGAWQEPDLSHPHNVVLDYWTRLGLGGLAVLALLQAGFWRAALRAWRRALPGSAARAALAGAMGSMAYFLAHGLVDNSYFVVDLAYVFCFTAALVARLAPTDDNRPRADVSLSVNQDQG